MASAWIKPTEALIERYKMYGLDAVAMCAITGETPVEREVKTVSWGMDQLIMNRPDPRVVAGWYLAERLSGHGGGVATRIFEKYITYRYIEGFPRDDLGG